MIVADTNVIAYLALPSPYTKIAEQLLTTEAEWIAPVLWRSELRNVLAMYMRKSLISFEGALGIQSELEDFMREREYDISSLDVLSLANQSSCSAYDCEFVALARSFQCNLITMDKKLKNSFSETAILLTDYV